MTTIAREVVGGVDTHADTHHAAVIDTAGRRLGDAQFPTTPVRYAALLAFLILFGVVLRAGIEGTGSYGAGLARFLRAQQSELAEVIHPNRHTRRMRGRSDAIDAYAAAMTVLAEPVLPAPKSVDGSVEAIRQLLVTRRSAVKPRIAAQVQIKSLLVTAPDPVRVKYPGMMDSSLIAALSRSRCRSGDGTVIAATLHAPHPLARRHQHLTGEITDRDHTLEQLVSDQNPALGATKRRRTRHRGATARHSR